MSVYAFAPRTAQQAACGLESLNQVYQTTLASFPTRLKSANALRGCKPHQSAGPWLHSCCLAVRIQQVAYHEVTSTMDERLGLRGLESAIVPMIACANLVD